MHKESIYEDAAMLFYECYSKWDGNDFTELYKSMSNDEIDALYTITDEIFYETPSFENEIDKYAPENVMNLIRGFVADCIYYSIGLYS